MITYKHIISYGQKIIRHHKTLHRYRQDIHTNNHYVEYSIIITIIIFYHYWHDHNHHHSPYTFSNLSFASLLPINHNSHENIIIKSSPMVHNNTSYNIFDIYVLSTQQPSYSFMPSERHLDFSVNTSF